MIWNSDLKTKVDFVAFSLSAGRTTSELRDILDKAKSKAKIIAKIEDVEGLENIDKIIELVDGIMIGRGDFGIEIGLENMPMVQRNNKKVQQVRQTGYHRHSYAGINDKVAGSHQSRSVRHRQRHSGRHRRHNAFGRNRFGPISGGSGKGDG